MIKFIVLVFFFFLFFSPFFPAHSVFKNSLLIAQEDSLFDDSDLADIEGSDNEDQLDEEFKSFGEGEVVDNFEEEDFEVMDEEEEAKQEEELEERDEEIEDDFNKDDYEEISDRPDYEVISDKELEKEFEGDDSVSEEQSASSGDSALKDIEFESDPVLDISEEFVSEDDKEKEGEELTEGETTEEGVAGSKGELAVEGDREEMEEIPLGEDTETAEGEKLEGSEEGSDLIEGLAVEGDREEMEEIPLGEDTETAEWEKLEGSEEEGSDLIEGLAVEGDREEMEEIPLGEDTETAEGEKLEGSEEEGSDLIEGLAVEGDMDEVEEGAEIVMDEEALNLITNIRYLADKDQIVIDCSEPTSYQARKNLETNQFVIEILQAKLADNLHWPYVLRDFDTDFGLIKADQKDSSTVRIIVQLKEGASFPQSVLTENNNQILVAYGQVVGNQIIRPEDYSEKSSDPSSILPAKTLEDLYFGDIKFSGTPISFHVIDAPIKQVLRFISEESGLNMVIGESVEGTVTLKLEDVPWDQALYTIFKVKSLGYARDGNVITILPLDEIAARTKKLKEIADRRKSLVPYITKVIPVNYGKIDDIAGKLKDFATPKSDVSAGGKIISHTDSNTLVVIDTPEAIKKMESLVQYLDKPPKQVMVETKIVEAAENFVRSFGLGWNFGGNYEAEVTIDPAGFLNFGNTAGTYGGRIGKVGTFELNLNGLPLIGDLSATLSLAEKDGHVKVISSPKVVVISGKTASITRNSPILVPVSVTTTTNSVGTSTQAASEREDVSVSLTVTPTVTTTGSVFLNISVDRTDPGTGKGAFKIQRSAKTEILAKNGQTVVIGGIYEQNESVTNEGFPFFKNIPFLSMLFNVKGESRSNNELLIFITPRLLDSHE